MTSQPHGKTSLDVVLSPGSRRASAVAPCWTHTLRAGFHRYAAGSPRVLSDSEAAPLTSCRDTCARSTTTSALSIEPSRRRSAEKPEKVRIVSAPPYFRLVGTAVPTSRVCTATPGEAATASSVFVLDVDRLVAHRSVGQHVATIGSRGESVESVGEPLHGALTIDEVGQQRVH